MATTDADSVFAFDQRAVARRSSAWATSVGALRSFYGEHARAAASLARPLQAMIGLGGRVFQDGEPRPLRSLGRPATALSSTP